MSSPRLNDLSRGSARLCGGLGLLLVRRLRLHSRDRAGPGIDLHFFDVRGIGLRDIERPDQLAMLTLQFELFDRAAWNASKRGHCGVRLGDRPSAFNELAFSSAAQIPAAKDAATRTRAAVELIV
jgi:hypothetical protein